MDWTRYDGEDGGKDRGKPMSEQEAAEHIKKNPAGPEIQSTSIDEMNGERFRVWLEKETGKSWEWVNRTTREQFFKSADGEKVRFSLRRVSGFLLRTQGVEHYFRKAWRCDRFYAFVQSDNKMAWVDAATVRAKGQLIRAGRSDRPPTSDIVAEGEGAYLVPWKLHTVKDCNLSEYGPGGQMRMF